MIPDRRLTAVITIAGGDKGETVVETVTLENFRASADIRIYGDAAMGELDCRIYGLSLSLMSQITAIGPIKNQFLYKNQIELLATNDAGGMTTVFTGNIAYAYADLNEAPDVAVIIHAVSGGNLGYGVAPQIAYKKPVSVVTLMQNIAQAGGLKFENHGVIAMLPPCNYDGMSLLDQIRAIADDSGVNWEVANGILYIWPKDGNLTDPAQEITVGKNMVGYPAFNSADIFVKAEFLPFMRIGGLVKVSGSEVIAVNGTWKAYQVSHELDSILPNGRWFTTVGAFYKVS